jgi:phage tail protein X
MNRYIKLKQLKDKSTNKRYFSMVKYPVIDVSNSDIYIRTKIGDRLDNLAYRYYDDSSLWWIITTANPDVIRRDSFYVKSNLLIRIPQNINHIKQSFEDLNS